VTSYYLSLHFNDREAQVALEAVAPLNPLNSNYIIRVMMEALRTSETSVFSETTQRYIPEGVHLFNLSFKTKLY
jgi:hypothetical protein